MSQEAITEIDMDVFSRRIAPYFSWLESRIESGWEQSETVAKDVLKEVKYIATNMRARFIIGLSKEEFTKEVQKALELFELAMDAFPSENEEIETKSKQLCKGIAEELGDQFLPNGGPRPPTPPEPHPVPEPNPEPVPEPEPEPSPEPQPQEPENKPEIKIKPEIKVQPEIKVKPEIKAKSEIKIKTKKATRKKKTKKKEVKETQQEKTVKEKKNTVEKNLDNEIKKEVDNMPALELKMPKLLTDVANKIKHKLKTSFQTKPKTPVKTSTKTKPKTKSKTKKTKKFSIVKTVKNFIYGEE